MRDREGCQSISVSVADLSRVTTWWKIDLIIWGDQSRFHQVCRALALGVSMMENSEAPG